MNFTSPPPPAADPVGHGALSPEQERDAQAQLAQAADLLAARNPQLPAFIHTLYGRAGAEDLAAYSPQDLATLAAEAFAFVAERPPGAPKIRIANPVAKDGGSERLSGISVIEIVNDDMPFLVDSVMAELAEHGVHVLLVAHPVLTLTRQSDTLTQFGSGETRESFIHIHVERLADEMRASLTSALAPVLADVRLAVTDWQPMLTRVRALIAELKDTPPPLPVDEIAEAVQFLEWLCAGNFTFLGIREHALAAHDDRLEANFESGLGLMRDREMHVLRRSTEGPEVTPEIRAFLNEPRLLIVTKAAVRARVHRRVYMDLIEIKRYGASGAVAGNLRIVGLFTSSAYTRSTASTPYLRRKVDTVRKRAGFAPDGHSGKALANVLENFARDELFQIDDDTLYHFALAILQLEERPRVRILARRDRFDRFVSIFVFVPRDRYNSRVREQIGQYLSKQYHGRVSAFAPYFSESPLVRVHFIIGRRGGSSRDPDRAMMETDVEALVRTWSDSLLGALTKAHDATRARALHQRFRDAFPAGYQETFAPAEAIADIRIVEHLSADRPLGVDFYSRSGGAHHCVGLKVWSFDRPIPLSERVPVLENMGFRVVDERTFDIDPDGIERDGIWLHDMTLERADGGVIDLKVLKQPLEAAFLMAMRGLAENDGYNALVLTANLWWRDVSLIRAISRFLQQTGIAFSQDYMWRTLGKHAGVAGDLVALFNARFDPRGEKDRDAQQARIADAIETALQSVAMLDEDRILRAFRNAIQSALRTNFFQIGNDGQPSSVIAIKYDSRKLESLPLPKPLYEIFVYSPRVEGVHLRFGKVARGGIRWSDRAQDFRTEVLGLVKAQQVKNAVIVPVGAKGGFYPKHLPVGGAREAIAAEGVASYKIFIGALLDITDNLRDGKIVPPDNVVRHDGDDPYLVVAADKGTATFSDTANAIALERGFWLGDAFASGGSVGYDHKVMGITARGAWEAVRRHFREMDTDITTTPFSVIGIGDMSGDVFGNGMLRENTIRLIAAFDHRDIFIDPDPDPKKSFAERERLFALPRSSWQDYDKALISKGGGVFPRSLKEIALTPEVQKVLGVTEASATPLQVMQAILKAPADLLFFGGIGTYIRATSETDAQAGDRANDAIRITAPQLRCKVIGEGANLGMTQRARVEAALGGVRLNTDAIDNSAGVNTSDVEVNIKIALSLPVASGALTYETRNALLAEMTEEVGHLVLRNNYLQTLAISLTQRRGMDDLGFQQRLMQTLEQSGDLNRAVELLPDDMALMERRRKDQPLTRPELAVLLAYAKLTLFDDLLQSKVPDDDYLARELGRYFPKALSARFPDALKAHRLRREIIATQLSNSMINRGGPALIVRMVDETGAAPGAIATAFAATRDSYEMPELNDVINALDAKVPGELQLSLYAAVQDLLLDRLVWFLRNADFTQGLAPVVAHFKDGIAQVSAALDKALSAEARAASEAYAKDLQKAGVPAESARLFSCMPALRVAPDIVLVADRAKRPVGEVAAIYFAVSDHFQIDRIVATARGIAVEDYFDRLAFDRSLDQIGEAVRAITAGAAAPASGGGQTGRDAVASWIGARQAEADRIRASVHEIAASGMTLSKLSVAASLLGDLAKK